MSKPTLESVVSAFGLSAKAKLSNPAIKGAPEDQLRGPLETLIRDGLAPLAGVSGVELVGETTLADIKTRPDYAVTAGKALVGFIEVKSPGKGADPRKFSDAHDRDQWERLKSLPNLLYTDGASFGLWRDGAPAASIVRLEGDVESSGAKLTAPDALVPLLADFLTWKPIPPKTAKALAEISARLCRLLRDEVTEQLALGTSGLVGLKQDWRKLLFPDASDAQFADGYAQAVTFGLLIARTRNISLEDGVDHAAAELKKTSSLIGTALGLLTDDKATRDALKTSLGAMARVLGEMSWEKVSKEDPDAWLYFYEYFLDVYDKKLRKLTGSYYTPPEVVTAMVRLVDETLRAPLFGRPAGLASHDVTVADPAVGTGTFLLGVMRSIAATVSADMGQGAVPGEIAKAAERLIGFELQFGPFAVAQLRLIAEFQELMELGDGKSAALPKLNLFVADTLANPFVEEDWLPQYVQPIASSRREANAIKKGKPITVVIGNPPYKEKADGRGGWIEAGSGDDAKAPMEWWRPPTAWGVGAHTKHLKNLYVYFWRWASWKVFGAGHYAATGLKETDEEGIVSYITVSGFLNGPGFQQMRADLRKSCSDIWVIDCSPEGHQPEVGTRVFQGVQHPVCVVIAARKLGKDDSKPARVRFRSLPEGRREEKFAALEKVELGGAGWTPCPDGWRDPFLPIATGVWAEFPALKDLFVYNGSGVMPGRTWVIAPDDEVFRKRWERLRNETDPSRKEFLFHPQLRDGLVASRHIRKVVEQALGEKPTRSLSILMDRGECPPSAQYGYRSFDRQWIIADARLINDVRLVIWNNHSEFQIYLTAPDDLSPTSGPALTLTDLIPDLHHYNGRGGRVLPLWRDQSASLTNVEPALLAALADTFGTPVSTEDVMAYLAAIMAHSAFTTRFARDLKQPGLRVPLTADATMFSEAVSLGREVVWLHCYGERSTTRMQTAPRRRRGSRSRMRRRYRRVGPSRPHPIRCQTKWTTIPPRAG